MNFRLLNADEIECRVKKVTDKGAIILLYKTARTDMDLLDETVSPENWESDYKEIKGNLFAGIAIKTESGVVWKWDCGIESREDEEGNQKKGEASDSFKRAGFKWGIGRELYTAPFIFISADKMKIENKKTFDTFSVQNIEYDDKRRISLLTIVNDKTSKVCYSFNAKSKDKPKESDEKDNSTDTDTTSGEEQKKAICPKCGKEILPFIKNDKTIMPNEQLKSMGSCATCYKKALHENK